MKVGIFFGGQSREREISFAGGRTVFDNLDKNLFQAIPIFVDSLGNFIELDWQYIYKGTIRDFYPADELIPKNIGPYQLYIESFENTKSFDIDSAIERVGKKISPEKLHDIIDFAFLALHGPFGEDGSVQGLLEWYNIPYSGCGILPSAIGIDKAVQKAILEVNGFKTPKYLTFEKSAFSDTSRHQQLLEDICDKVGLPFVVKAPNQGSSIGISVVSDKSVDTFREAINNALFIEEVSLVDWKAKSEEEKSRFIAELIDIRSGIGLPIATEDGLIIKLPMQLKDYLDQQSENKDSIDITALHSEQEILIEAFIDGREFSCIVIENENGTPVSLPPTEIIKGKELFDYRSKYLPGISRKLTPIQIEDDVLNNIRLECQRLFTVLNCNVYARLDGFVTKTGEIYLNDPNTTSGMLPSSFFFHQAAEISLTPSQLITYIIRTSLKNRLKRGKNSVLLSQQLKQLDIRIETLIQAADSRIPIAVVMGGYSSERHISVESGRNIFEKLASSTSYRPIPIFLSGSDESHELHLIPINVMLKDNADDILEKVKHYAVHPVIDKIKNELSGITHLYAGMPSSVPTKIDLPTLKELVKFVFIALHGKPGEDGAFQNQLLQYNIPFNGSGVDSSRITINKYEANELLRKNGILVAKHRLLEKEDFLKDPQAAIDQIEQEFSYPIITKPADDGCSSAVKKINNRTELEAFAVLMFRDTEALSEEEIKTLSIKKNEEFPRKSQVLIEELIIAKGADHFIEITGGMVTSYDDQGKVQYEVFEPSEALASGEVLSLEEKFLAGEGQNITPARFAKDKEQRDRISAIVKEDFKTVAHLLNVEGYCRIDAFVRVFPNSVETVIIEINSLPGMTPATCIFHQSAINGYTPFDFIDKIIKFGIQRQNMIPA